MTSTRGPVVTVTVLDPPGFTESTRVRRVLVEIPAGAGATCPVCEAVLKGAALVDAHDFHRRVGLLTLFEEPSDGSAVEFAPCGCRWDSAEDDRVFLVVPCGDALGFRLVDPADQAPGLSRGRGM